MKKLLLLIFLGMFLIGCSDEAPPTPQPPLMVGTNIWPGYECLYLARSVGFYEKAPIKLVEYTSASEVIRSYRNGSIDVAALTMDEVFLLAESGQSPKVVLIMDFSKGGDVVLAKPEIKDLSDIKGRRVGVESSALGAFVLTRALEKAGMNPQDVEVVPLEVDEHENAFLEGKVDAVVTFEPVRSKLLDAGASLLFDSTQMPGEIVDVLVVRKEILENHAASLDILLRGWFQALNYLKEHPEDSARRIAPREGITPEQFLSSLKGLHIPNWKENLEQLKEKDSSTLKGMARLSQVMIERKLLNKPLNPSELIDTDPLENIK